MTRVFSVLAAGLAVSMLTACGPAVAPPTSAPAAEPAGQGDAGYLAAPMATSIRSTADGLRLDGVAPGGGRVRLAPPEGQPLFAEADDRGVWTLTLPVSAQARIFGLSATAGDRTTQSEGYLLVTAQGEAAVLRAGGGAVRIGEGSRSGLDAVDFDREGGAVISGRAPAGAGLSIHVDGRKLGEGRADSKGRYAIALTRQPLTGRRQIDVFGDAKENPVVIDVTPAPPLVSGPFRVAEVEGGLRVDWMTPGGGAQSTVLVK